MKVDFAQPWYHGSPLRLEVLRAGSFIIQLVNLTRAFSNASQWEWITRHAMQLRCIEERSVQPYEILTEEDIRELRQKQVEKGALSFEEERADD
jgi:hypothetical protein